MLLSARVTGIQPSTATVTNGHYAIDGLLPGNPTVSIIGPSHVDHQTYDVQISGTTATRDFTVLRWGSERFGVVYDAGFHAFFNLTARSPDRTPPVVIKWAQLPQEIYVVNQGISLDALADVLVLLGEVNQESLSDIFGGTALPVPITIGPTPTQQWVPGRILVEFAQGNLNFGQMGCNGAGGVMDCGLLQIGLMAFVAMWLMYHSDTKPGNTYPDTNPH
jgi:hypothetical protein